MSQENKDIAVDFLLLASSGKVDEAYEKYVDMNGKQHNVYFPAGFPALQEAMREAHEVSPNQSFTPMMVLSDGDLVVVHSRVIRQSNDPVISVVHMFRIENGKIIEMWDTGIEVPPDSPNADGAF